VTADALDRNVKLVGCRVARTRDETDLARGQSHVDVQHRDRVDLRIVHRARFDHRQRAAGAFFRRLEQEDGRSVQVRPIRLQHARRTEQHRRVRVVTARVHLPRYFGTKRFSGPLVERQRVHVGAQARNLPRQRTAHDPDHARLCDPSMFDAERVQLALDDRRRAFFFESELRKTMDLAADRDRALGNVGNDGFDRGHTLSFARRASASRRTATSATALIAIAPQSATRAAVRAPAMRRAGLSSVAST